MSKRLHIGKGERGFSLPIDLVTSTQAIIARKRVGKSYTADIEAEEMLALGHQVGIIDPTGAHYGLKSSANGKSEGYPIVIFGGDHADAPLDFRSGRSMAKAFIEHGFSAIWDISKWDTEEQIVFVDDFAREMLKSNSDAVHLFIDEADTYAPQLLESKEQKRCLGSMRRLVKQGGIKGVGITLITQRGADLNKSLMSQIDSLVLLIVSHPPDVQPAVDWVSSNISAEDAARVKAEVPKLKKGEAFFCGHGKIERVEVRAKRTFDSGITPKPGERKIQPKVLATVDVQKLGQQIKESVERAAAEDPANLRKRIAELERELKKPAAPAPVVQNTATTEKVRMLTAQVKRLEKGVGAYEKQMAIVMRLAGSLSQTAEEIKQAITTAQNAAQEALAAPLELTAATSAPAAPAPVVARRAHIPGRDLVAADFAAPKAEVPAGDRKPITGTALKIASIAAGYGGQPIKRSVLAAMCGLSDGGSFSGRLSEAKTSGAIVIDAGQVYATPEGIAAYSGRFQAPTTTEEVLAIWKPKLGAIQNQILDCLVEAGGEPVSKESIAESIGVSNGGTFSGRLSEVRATGLMVDAGKGMVAANKDALFL